MPNSFWLVRITNIQNIIEYIVIVHLKKAYPIVVEDADAK